jgi:hypothetical protein
MASEKIATDSMATEGVVEPPIVKISKANRYYYRHRETVLEKQRLARLAKKGVDVSKLGTEQLTPLEERRKKKMELLGLLESK